MKKHNFILELNGETIQIEDNDDDSAGIIADFQSQLSLRSLQQSLIG